MAYALEAGVATIEITPPVGVKLWGYQLRKDPSTGVLDPLYAKAVVFDDGETRAALVSLDLGRTPPDEYISRIRNMVKEKFQIEQTLLAATHTHSGPYFGFSDLPDEWIDEMWKDHRGHRAGKGENRTGEVIHRNRQHRPHLRSPGGESGQIHYHDVG